MNLRPILTRLGRWQWPVRQFQRWSAALYGFDYFISYRWSDGKHYAEKLARVLRARGFEVFFDRDSYWKGNDLDRAGRTAVYNSSYLILVGSPNALVPPRGGGRDWVLRELEVFVETGRTIVPISFGGTLEPSRLRGELASLVPPSILRIDEAMDALLQGPGNDTVESIVAGFHAQRRSQKRIRTLQAVAALLLILTCIATLLYIQANAARERAERQTTISRAEALVATAQRQLSTEPLRALSTALRAVELTRSTLEDQLVLPSANEALRQALGEIQGVALDGSQGQVSPDGKWAVANGLKSGAALYDLSADDPSAVAVELSKTGRPAQAIAISRDSKVAALAEDDGKVRLWPLAASTWRQPLRELATAGTAVRQLAISEGAGQVVALDSYGRVLFWSDSPNPRWLDPSLRGVGAMRLSPNGNWLVLLDGGFARLWSLTQNVATSVQLELENRMAFALAAEFSPDSRVLALADTSGMIWVIEPNAARATYRLCPLGRHQAISLCWSRSGDSLASAGGEEGIKLWSSPITSPPPRCRDL